MGGFLLRRLGAALVVLLLASMLVFIGIRALPGDPATALGGPAMRPEQDPEPRRVDQIGRASCRERV